MLAGSAVHALSDAVMCRSSVSPLFTPNCCCNVENNPEQTWLSADTPSTRWACADDTYYRFKSLPEKTATLFSPPAKAEPYSTNKFCANNKCSSYLIMPNYSEMAIWDSKHSEWWTPDTLGCEERQRQSFVPLYCCLKKGSQKSPLQWSQKKRHFIVF